MAADDPDEPDDQGDPRKDSDPGCWSDWLSVGRVAEVYDTTRSTVYKLKGKGGIRWATVPGLGLRFYRPDIDRYIESCVPELAKKLHEIQFGSAEVSVPEKQKAPPKRGR